MNTTSPLRAFHDSQSIKDKYVQRVHDHRKADARRGLPAFSWSYYYSLLDGPPPPAAAAAVAAADRETVWRTARTKALRTCADKLIALMEAAK